jgi:hypothetical protein
MYNEPNARKLYAHLQQVPPAEFDYGSCLLTRDRGCVAYHVVKQRWAKPDGVDAAGVEVLERFLGLPLEEARELFRGRTPLNERSWRTGHMGILDAMATLSNIADRYGVVL